MIVDLFPCNELCSIEALSIPVTSCVWLTCTTTFSKSFLGKRTIARSKFSENTTKNTVKTNSRTAHSLQFSLLFGVSSVLSSLTCTGIQLSRKLSRKKNNSALQVLRKHNQNTVNSILCLVHHIPFSSQGCFGVSSVVSCLTCAF